MENSENKVRAVSDGTYTLSETENENQFLFYRNDEGELGEITNEPMDLFQAYIMNKMMFGEISGMAMYNFYCEISESGKYLRLTVSDMEVKSEDDSEETSNPNTNKKHVSFLKRLFNKIFG